MKPITEINPGRNYVVPATAEIVEYFDNDPNRLKVACSVSVRPGAALFCRKVELELYPPGTEANDDVDFVELMFEGLAYAVLIVPMGDKSKIEGIAASLGMRLADGIPHVVSSQSVTRFPFRSLSTYTLEYRKSSIAYSGGQAALEQMDQIYARQMLELEARNKARQLASDRHYWGGMWWRRRRSDEPPEPGHDTYTDCWGGRHVAELTHDQRLAKRPGNYDQLSKMQRWEIDKRLGLLLPVEGGQYM